MDKFFGGFVVIWIIAALASVTLLGVVIWALIQIVPAIVSALN